LENFVTLAAYIVVFLLIRELAWSFSAQPWMVALPLLVVAAFEAVTGLTQAFSGVSVTGDSIAARGTYVNRNHFAGLLNMAAPFAVVYPVAVLRKNLWMRQLSVRSALKISLGLIGAALLLLGVLYSVSRMGLFACAASLLIMSIVGVGAGLSVRKKWVVRGAIGVLVLLALVFLAPVQMIMRFAELSGSGNLTAGGYLSLWRETGSLIAAYPVFGCGLGGYEAALHRYKVTSPLLSYDYAHNDYLQLLAELGIVGFALLAALAVGIVIKTLHLAVNRERGDHRYVALACLGSFSAIALHSMTDFNFYIQANAMELAWVGGLAAGLVAHTGHRDPLNQPGPPC
jgi:O-antigen ligase